MYDEYRICHAGSLQRLYLLFPNFIFSLEMVHGVNEIIISMHLNIMNNMFHFYVGYCWRFPGLKPSCSGTLSYKYL